MVLDPVQMRRKIESSLILKNITWADLIYTTEKELKYFRGQLSFTLISGICNYYLANNDCKWDAKANTVLYDLFVFYVNKKAKNHF